MCKAVSKRGHSPFIVKLSSKRLQTNGEFAAHLEGRSHRMDDTKVSHRAQTPAFTEILLWRTPLTTRILIREARHQCLGIALNPRYWPGHLAWSTSCWVRFMPDLVMVWQAGPLIHRNEPVLAAVRYAKPQALMSKVLVLFLSGKLGKEALVCWNDHLFKALDESSFEPTFFAKQF